MTDEFRNKVQAFTDGVSTQDRAETIQQSETTPYLYHDHHQTCEKGEKRLDPATGLIYFKYDFGYEFGVVGPNDDRAIEEDAKKSDSLFVDMSGDIRPTVGSEARLPQS